MAYVNAAVVSEWRETDAVDRHLAYFLSGGMLTVLVLILTFYRTLM